MSTDTEKSTGEDAENTYDQLPYPGSPFPQTHPGRLATVGTLFGMRPAKIGQCRVLELGCTDGGNLIPMAVAYPESEFIGIDLSSRQINVGAAVVESLELTNIQLVHQNIVDVQDEYGTFDYIIAHGVYSWVAQDVQEAMLALCRRLLNPQGIAYISYNTYPGWHVRGMIRDMILYHTRQFADPQQQVDQAQALVDFVTTSAPDDDSPYRTLLSAELEKMKGWADSYIFHESLETHNHPLYFHQFAERAEQAGLRYLGEAAFNAMLPHEFDDSVVATLNDIGRDIVEVEQYMDFLRNRMFRQTLLCHAEVDLDRTLSSNLCNEMTIRAMLRPETDEPDVAGASAVEFLAVGDVTITARSPIQKAAFLILAVSYPVSLTFEELLKRARGLLHQSATEFHSAQLLADQENDLREALFRCFCDHVVEFQVDPPSFAAEPGDRPLASPLARLQAEPSSYVTTLTHEQVQVDAVGAHLLKHLDGRNDVDSLVKILVSRTQDGDIVATQNGEILDDPARIEQELTDQVRVRLMQFAQQGLLAADNG